MNHGMNNPTGIYIQYYNAIARTLTALGKTTTLKTPNTSSVTQTDLNTLRIAIRSLAGMTLDYTKFNSHRTEEDAFDKYRMSVNDKQGFLVVPGKYTNNGPDLYEYELDESGEPLQDNVLSFSSVPVLYEHFQDMMKVLNSLKYIIKDITNPGQFQAKAIQADPYYYNGPVLNEGDIPEPTFGYPQLPYYTYWRTANIGGQPSTPNVFQFTSMYCRTHYLAQKSNSPNVWENVGSNYRIFLLSHELIAKTDAVMPIVHEREDFYSWTDDEGPQSRDFYEPNPYPDYTLPVMIAKIHHFTIPRQHIVWVVPDDFALPPWILLDHRENGLLYCGCEDDDFAKCSTQGPYEIRYGLGSTDNAGGARLRLYETNLRMPYFDAYCLDKETVSISDFGSVRTVTRDGETIRFRFSTALRPNGALVPMFWKFDGDDTTYALPVSGCGYRLSMVNATDWEIRFSDKAVHVFNNLGVFSKAYLKKDDEILSATWTGIAVTNQSGTPSVCTVTSPQGTAQMSYTSGNPEALLTLAYRIMPATPGKLYGHTTVVSAGRKRGFVHRLLLDPTIANPTVGDLSVVSEAYISLPSEDEAEAPETETTTGSLEQPYSSLKTAWTHDNEAGDLRLVTSTVNGKSFSQAQKIRPSSRGDLVLESTAGEDSAQPLTTRFEYDDNGLRTRQDNPDGTWQNWNYDFSERLLRSIRPFKVLSSASRRAASADELEVTEYSYEPNAPGEIVEPGDTRVRRTIRTINDIEVERSYQVYLENEYRSIRCRTSGATWDAPDNLVTISYAYPSGDWQGRHWKTVNPDGTASLTTYAVGDSDGLVETTDSGVLNQDGTAIIDGTRQIVTKNTLGFTTAREIVDIASGLTLDTTTYEVDFAGRPLKTVYADGSESTIIYACCGPYKQTDQAGTVTTTTYTPDKKVAGREQAGVRVAYTYAPNGAVAETRTIGTDGSYQLSVNQYAENGLLTAVKTALEVIPVDTDPPETDDAYAVTSFAEAADPQTGGWIRTTTYPDGGIRVEEYDQTGSLRHAHGTAVAAEMEYENLLLNAEVCARSALIRPNGIREVTDVLTDFAGRQYKTVHPNGSYDLTEFDVLNRPWRQTAADGTVRITEYNPKGEISRTGIDLDRDGELTGDDPVTVYENDVVLKESVAVRRRTTREQDGNDLVTVNISESTADGNRNWQSTFGRTSSFRRSYINDGEERGMTETAVQPDGVSETRSYSDGLLESSLHSVLGETLYTYDAFNRQETVSHVEGGIEHVAAYQYDGRNQVTAITETGGSSSREMSFTYDLNGRKLSETKPGDRTVLYEYYPTGELKMVSGAETYPQSYTYEAGRLATLTTFRDAPALPAVTAWRYNAYGQLSAKEYADASRIDYTYNAFGQLVARKWARNRVTTYAYDTAGRLDGLTYDGSDTAPITSHYDQRGRLTQVTDAAGTRTLTYNPDNTPAVETIPYAPLQPLHRGYDALGRPLEIRLGDGGCTYLCFNADPVRGIRRLTETAASFALEFAMGPWEERANLPYQPPNTTFAYDGVNYDDFGRPETHPAFGKHRERLAPYLIDETAGGFTLRYAYGDDGRLHQTTSVAGTQTTAYVEGSNQLASRTWRPAGGPPRTQTWSYDDFRRLTGIEFDGNVLAGYTLDAADRRVRTALPDGSAWDYAYDDLGQLTSAQRDSINAMAYAYDTIGNRQTATEDAATTAYTANDLNQYTAVNSEIPTYDADGNLLTNAGWTYHWNAENRLIRAENGTVRVEANYDYQGRRFEKKVFYGNTLTQHQYFVYDGYKLAAILDALNDGQITTTFTWQPTGPDTPLTMTYKGVTGYYLTDGNKNVLKVVKSDGTELATYTYSPFGQTLSATGPWANINPFRFSSEYHDTETVLIYYNYRHYSPILGRWINRDPIEEQGGVNLYGILKNNLIDYSDHLGLEKGVGINHGIRNRYKGSCYCGKDITEALNNILSQMDQLYNDGEFTEGLAKGFKKGFVGLGTDGWDISTLFHAGFPPSHESYQRTLESKQGPSKKCQGTVVVNGKCYYAEEVNYIMWGKLIQLRNKKLGINDSYDTLLNFYRSVAGPKLWLSEGKSPSQGTDGRLFWATVGFNSGSSLANISDISYTHPAQEIVVGSGYPTGYPPAGFLYPSMNYPSVIHIDARDVTSELVEAPDCKIDPNDKFTGSLEPWSYDLETDSYFFYENRSREKLP